MSPSAGETLNAARLDLVLTREELWTLYVGLGGMRGIDELNEYLAGTVVFSRLEHNILVQALNEGYLDLGRDHPVAYLDAHP